MQFSGYMQTGGTIMWIILLLSVVAFALVLERVFFFWKVSSNPTALESAFGRALASGDEEEIRCVLAGRSSLQMVFSAAYAHWAMKEGALERVLEAQVRRELYRWEKHLPLLDVIARTAPLLGLLGTVLGMVEMFQSLNLGETVNAQVVTGGIWKALFTTVAGLGVAIPVVLAHGVLSGRIDKEEEALRRGVDFAMIAHFRSEEGADRIHA